MRNFGPLPGQYTSLLENAVSRAVEEVRRDVYRRQTGQSPIIADVDLDRFHAPEVAVTVADATLLERVSVAIGEAARARRRKRPA